MSRRFTARGSAWNCGGWRDGLTDMGASSGPDRRRRGLGLTPHLGCHTMTSVGIHIDGLLRPMADGAAGRVGAIVCYKRTGMSYLVLSRLVLDPLHAEDGGGYVQATGHNHGPQPAHS